MSEPCEMGWLVLHSATDNMVVRHVVARTDAVCGTHGNLWPCMTMNDDTKETQD